MGAKPKVYDDDDGSLLLLAFCKETIKKNYIGVALGQCVCVCVCVCVCA